MELSSNRKIRIKTIFNLIIELACAQAIRGHIRKGSIVQGHIQFFVTELTGLEAIYTVPPVSTNWFREVKEEE